VRHRTGSTYHYVNRSHRRYHYVHRPRFVWVVYSPTVHTHHEVHRHNGVQYVVVESDQADIELACPGRSDFRSSSRASWCETRRGTRHGPWVQYHLNGEVKEEGYYEYGEREGLWVKYYSNGVVREEGEYEGGERVGMWVRFDRSGHETTVTEYR
jgi:hypothetical protein